MKYRFEITYQPVYFKKASEMMRKMDLDIGEIGIKEIITFTADDIAVKYIKDRVVEAFANADLIVLHIEGGKVE